MINPGDVVTVYFIGAVESKRRPAIVISSDAFNDQNYDLVVVLVTSNLRLASTPFDYHLQNWQQTGLKGAGRCEPLWVCRKCATLARSADFWTMIGRKFKRDCVWLWKFEIKRTAIAFRSQLNLHFPFADRSW